jgi:hypothetical protein
MNPADKSTYKDFLKKHNIDFIRLHNFSNCDEPDKAINVSAECPWNVEGKGTSYSFRKKQYVSRFFSDIQYRDGEFRIPGIYILGFVTNLGGVPIETVSLRNRGIQKMTEFVPSTNENEVVSQRKAANVGFRIDGYIYKTSMPMKLNSTFAMRSIAYRGKVYKGTGKGKVDILKGDARRDIVVVFRVIRKHQDGSVSVLWKKLRDEQSPKLRK